MTDAEALLQQGSRYKDYESFKRALMKYSLENNYVYTTVKSKRLTKADIANRPACSRRGGKPLNPELVMGYLHLGCKHYGNVRTTSRGLRPNQKTYKCGCESTIDVIADRHTNELVVKRFNEEHNHVTGPEQAQYYPERRRLSQAETTELKEQLLNRDIKPTSIQEYIQATTNKAVTTKDIYNLRKKYNTSTVPKRRRIAKEEPVDPDDQLEDSILGEENGVYGEADATDWDRVDDVTMFLDDAVEVEVTSCEERDHASVERVDQAWKCVYMVLEEENRRLREENARLTDEVARLRFRPTGRTASPASRRLVDFRTAVRLSPAVDCRRPYVSSTHHDYAKPCAVERLGQSSAVGKDVAATVDRRKTVKEA